MRLAVISCWKYRDAWKPCFELLRKFWPEIKYPDLITDKFGSSFDGIWCNEPFIAKSSVWCESVAQFAAEYRDEDICLLQEDFLLNSPVNQSLIEHALEQMKARNAGMVRLYPCPGADEDYGDPHYGLVKKGSEYRISCQTGIWRSDYLHAIASRCGSTPRDFELNGTRIAESLPDEVLAFKRESGEPPLSYFCSAISRSRWEPAAVEFCRQQGISVDLSMREMA